MREIGIRIALGGRPRHVVRLIVGSAWKVIGVGLALGVIGAGTTTGALEGILFGTSPTDPSVFALVVALLAAVATLASYVPARRATHVDPVIVLRQQ